LKEVNYECHFQPYAAPNTAIVRLWLIPTNQHLSAGRNPSPGSRG
jgi:hypothetical protein